MSAYTVEIQKVNIAEQDHYVVTCGGCGKTVEMADVGMQDTSIKCVFPPDWKALPDTRIVCAECFAALT